MTTATDSPTATPTGLSVRPLGHRVLIRPDPLPTETAGGIQLLQDASRPEMSGTVVRVGNGPAHPRQVRIATIQKCLRLLHETAEQVPASVLAAELDNALVVYLMEQIQPSDIHEGDTVFFPATAGSVLVVNGEKLLLMAEDDVAAVWKDPDERDAD